MSKESSRKSYYPALDSLRVLAMLAILVYHYAPHRMAGGFIGVELMENLRELGLDVTVVQRPKQLLNPLDADMAAFLHTQLRQKGEAYNNAYAQDYGQYQDYLNQLGTLHDYYSAQEQQQAARRQQAFNNVVTVLGVLGDAVQIALSGTTGLGSMVSGLLNTGYNIYSGNRQYEADRADTQWNQQLQERQYQDSLKQQLYENEASEREYQDKLNQQKFNNDITSQKLNIAMGEWNLKKNNAAQKASRAGSAASGTAASGSAGSGSSSGTFSKISHLELSTYLSTYRSYSSYFSSSSIQSTV